MVFRQYRRFSAIGLMIFLIHMDYSGLPLRCFFLTHISIGHDDHQISLLGHTGCRAVETDNSVPACYGIGGKAAAVININNLHLLKFPDARCRQQFAVDSDAPRLIKLGIRPCSAMDLGCQHIDLHGYLTPPSI